MNKHFSFWEVLISSVIVIVLAFVLIGSVVIMYRANGRLTAARIKTKCISDLDRIIKNEFEAANKVYTASDPLEESRLKKIDNQTIGTDAVAFLSDRELKVFVKKPEANNYSYYYQKYELNGVSIDESKPLKEYAKLLNTQNLFGKGCFAKKSDTAFKLKVLNKFESEETAVLLELNDLVYSSDKSAMSLSIRRLNEFR